VKTRVSLPQRVSQKATASAARPQVQSGEVVLLRRICRASAVQQQIRGGHLSTADGRRAQARTHRHGVVPTSGAGVRLSGIPDGQATRWGSGARARTAAVTTNALTTQVSWRTTFDKRPKRPRSAAGLQIGKRAAVNYENVSPASLADAAERSAEEENLSVKQAVQRLIKLR